MIWVSWCDWSSDVCSSDLLATDEGELGPVSLPIFTHNVLLEALVA
jgi:hypothetical protein